jgi:hypothetical protein
MVLLFRLPFLLLELLLRRVFGREEEERFAAAPAPPSTRQRPAPPAPAAASPNGAPPPTADEAIERRWEREAELVADPPPPPTPLRPISDTGHLDDDAELVESFGPADDVGGTITVQEPWDGYAGQPATAIVARLRGADPATKAVVALYERGHKNRATVLRATG